MKVFDETFYVDVQTLPDLIARNEKIKSCMSDYIQKQSKTYAKSVKQNLYDLINNFGNIKAKIQGRKPAETGKPYEEKIEALARLQCELYFEINASK